MTCQNLKCSSERLVDVYGKSSDRNVISIGENEHEGYVPSDLGIGGGDDISFTYCAECGQIQGDFPLPPTKLESGNNDD